jgi:putative transposase
MSGTTSSATTRPYGIKLVCRTWEQPRSSYYVSRRGAELPVPLAPAGKRGPKTALSDAELLELIRADLNASPFQGEGHRQVWARLRVRDGVKVGRRRLLRLLRQNNLLSPYRGRRGPCLHEGEIITQAPNLMWGTDGAKVFTGEEGWGWLFVTVEPWNPECMGWHVCKQGTRFAALEPISQGLRATAGSVAADAGRGLSLRMEHCTQYLSDHFQNPLKHWGIAPSFAFIEQPQTNGVAERFLRTLKEPVIYGRLFQNLQELRQAVRRFVDTYNREWLLEKKRLSQPLAGQGPVARPGLSRQGSLRKTCVQTTGCSTG